MTRRGLLTVAVLWTAAMGAGFVILFGHDATDDYAGWLPVTYVAQVPSFVALVTARGGEPLTWWRAGVVGVTAALMTAIGAMAIAALIARQIWSDPFDFTAVWVAFGMAIATSAACAFVFVPALHRRPHPHESRRILTIVVASGIAAFACGALARPHQLVEDGGAIVLASPILWTVPLWLACRRPRVDPVPRARAVD